MASKNAGRGFTFFECCYTCSEFNYYPGTLMTETMFIADNHCLAYSSMFPEMNVADVNLCCVRGINLPQIPVAFTWIRTSPSFGSESSVLTTFKLCAGLVLLDLVLVVSYWRNCLMALPIMVRKSKLRRFREGFCGEKRVEQSIQDEQNPSWQSEYVIRYNYVALQNDNF